MSEKVVPDNDGLPSYDDATAEPLGRVLSGPGLVSEVEYQRQELVRAAIENHVMPVLRRQARYGLARSVTVLEPYDPTAIGFEKSNTTKAGEVVSPMMDDVTLVQLEGDQNSPEFWKQPSVSQEMAHQLRVILSASTVFQGKPVGCSIAATAQTSKLAYAVNSLTQTGVEFKLPPRPEAARAQSSSSRNRWAKKLLGTSEVAMAHPAKNSDGIELSVACEDIIRRVENDFGLYETVSRPGLVVRILVESR